MSLKTFHIVFIVASTLAAVGFAVWALLRFGREGGGGLLAMGIGSAAAGVALVAYGIYFLRKLKDVSYL